MWLEMARESRRAANELMEFERHRSCVSRAYYAAYARVTHELVATAGLAMPADREGPSHPGKTGSGGIRRVIESAMPNLSIPRREKLSEWIGRLYTLRVNADYRPSVRVEGREAREALALLKKVFDIV